MRTCLRRSLATGLVFRRQLPLAPRCYAFLPGCGQGLALATTARPAPLRSALLLRRKLRRYLVSLRNRWPRQQPTPGSDAAQRVSPDFSPKFQFRAAAFAPAPALSLALRRLATTAPRPARFVARCEPLGPSGKKKQKKRGAGICSNQVANDWPNVTTAAATNNQTPWLLAAGSTPPLNL